MTRRMSWGFAILILLLGTAAVFIVIHESAENRKLTKLLVEAENLENQIKQGSDTHSETEQAADQASAKSETPTAEKTITNDDEVTATEKPKPQMSPFGLGLLPEIPKEMNAPYLLKGCETIEEELLARVMIKMHNEGIRSKYSSVGIDFGTGLITPIEYGSILVEYATDKNGEYATDKNGEHRIVSVTGHPNDVPPGTIYTRVSDIPSHLKIVTVDEIAIDPYEYLGLQKP